ncbi:MAG: translesion error-prone DNA polymerase V subunit UmuC [Desulfuromonas sp.]|nr:translesion error-prone DNA polymerase V subunit UmuC [Desulfuromonas sp.]
MTTFALVDCNNFYASCERLFRPELKNQPVAVLSNNDGCIVARSQEVKALGIKTGTPLFKVLPLLRQQHVHIFSSNYTLYGDLSARVMSTLEELSPIIEIYSIDEAFLNLSGISDPSAYGKQIRTRVYKDVGIPVSVGIAPTKTLAKLANYAAKKYPATAGVVNLMDAQRQQRLLAITPVAEVWGVGRKLSASLNNSGITTALELAQQKGSRIRRHYSVVLERTVRELNGEACLDLDNAPAAKQQIVCSRSFGSRINDYASLRETICEFAARAAQKLRRERQLASNVNVFIRTSPFLDNAAQYANSATLRLAYPSSDSGAIIAAATTALDSIYKADYPYAKAGVMLADFCSARRSQLSLFQAPAQTAQRDKLMQTIDNINHSGTAKVWFGGQRPVKDWFMQRDMVSPAYTTNWDCLPLV